MFMHKSLTVMSFLLLSGVLTACNQTTQTRSRAPEPVVVTSYQHAVVEFAYGGTELDKTAQSVLNDFILNNDISRKDDVLIEVVGEKGSRSFERARLVGAYLKRLDLSPRLVAVAPGGEVLNLQQVKIKLARYAAHVPDCPNWTKRTADAFSNGLSSNFGCAQAANLALMVADPRDLQRGRDLAPADGAFMANTLGLYQRSEGIYLESRKLTETE